MLPVWKPDGTITHSDNCAGGKDYVGNLVYEGHVAKEDYWQKLAEVYRMERGHKTDHIKRLYAEVCHFRGLRQRDLYQKAFPQIWLEDQSALDDAFGQTPNL